MKSTLVTFVAVLFAAVAVPLASAANKEKGDTPIKISQGEKVTLADYLVAGKTTVFDFTSKYCPPCQQIAPMLDKLHKERADIAVVKVDINRADVKGIDWRSPVAQQYKLESIPHFKIYGPDGKLVAEGDKATEKVMGWLN